MTPDQAVALAALAITVILLVAALGQALGERGRAGVGRVIDFFVSKSKPKEVPDDIPGA